MSLKLAESGIDDSNGTVGGCIGEIIMKISHIAHTNEKLMDYATSFCKNDTGFGFEDELELLLKKDDEENTKGV